MTDISVKFYCSGSTNGVQLIDRLFYNEWMEVSALNHLPNFVFFSIPVKRFFILSFTLTKYLFLRARQAVGHLESLSLSVLSFSDLKSWNKQVTCYVDLTCYFKWHSREMAFAYMEPVLESAVCKRHSCGRIPFCAWCCV